MYIIQLSLYNKNMNEATRTMLLSLKALLESDNTEKALEVIDNVIAEAQGVKEKPLNREAFYFIQPTA